MPKKNSLRKQVERQARRMKKAEQERPHPLVSGAYIGTLGLLFVLPVIGGMYFGDWLDHRSEGYSIHWTIIMLILGIVIGAINVYLFIRE